MAYSAAFPTLTRLRGLAPRHLRAAILSFFVHAQNRPKTAPSMGLKEKKYIKKIVQICALLCTKSSSSIDYLPFTCKLH
ncbi:hypothetical protein E4W45_14905 [Klebsiella pneumoniae]|nr:hypothetical protein [Klebsiella pneumoniae]PAT26376.1 hypothetical protein CJ307_07035 [Klebsiella quasipneumoniae]MBA0024027.1 hypothetical protein [Klebsiella pneumoniae]MBA0081310.1 hypothetical protein [Klebsiella pneumoniae]MBA0092784.1 hypothetical protein [Klebsiella pneumoniae]